MAVDFWTQKSLDETVASIQQCVLQMDALCQQVEAIGRRCSSLWAAAAALDPDGAAAAGTAFAADATSRWDARKASLAVGLDATAAGMGTTRQALLTQIAAVPATTFA